MQLSHLWQVEGARRASGVMTGTGTAPGRGPISSFVAPESKLLEQHHSSTCAAGVIRCVFLFPPTFFLHKLHNQKLRVNLSATVNAAVCSLCICKCFNVTLCFVFPSGQ